MYVAAASFYRLSGVKQYSAFDDPQGYAGSPPSVPYLKALFTDYTTAYRIFIERDIATLPFTIGGGDHTFDVNALLYLTIDLAQMLSSFLSIWVD